MRRSFVAELADAGRKDHQARVHRRPAHLRGVGDAGQREVLGEERGDALGVAAQRVGVAGREHERFLRRHVRGCLRAGVGILLEDEMSVRASRSE